VRKSRLAWPPEGGGKEAPPYEGGGARELERRLRELERALLDRSGRRLELSLQRVDVDASMGRGVGRQPTAGLLELALASDSVSPAGLVPGDGNVHEPLEEVSLGRFGCAPCVFQLLVGGEELAGSDQLQAALERVRGLRVFPKRAARRRP
jgi:hypothetical protein